MFKKIIFSILICFIYSLEVHAQTAQVEKSMFGAQTGFLGIWANHEARLTNTIALRTEVGLEAAIFGDTYYNNFDYAFIPIINLEPRWYYNLNKRQEKGRKTFKNNGNFLAFRVGFAPDAFAITNVDDAETINQMVFVPKWGIRRTIGNHFTYEAGIGIGYLHYFIDTDDYWFAEQGSVYLDLHIRIGYTF